MSTTKFIKYLIIVMLPLLFSLPSYAQIDDPDEDEDGENAPLDPSAPLDEYIVPMLLVGAATGYYLIKRKNKSIKILI